MGERIRRIPPPSWEGQVKALIRRRYAHFAESDRFSHKGNERAKKAGYPTDLLCALPSRIIETYSGCGYLLEGLDLSKSKVVVDLGCGCGLDSFLVAMKMEKKGLLIAVDLTSAMLGRLMEVRDEMSKKNNSTVVPLSGDMESLPLKAEIADLVIANASFNLTINQKTAFKEAARILRPGGRLVARELIREGPLSADLALDPMAWNTSLGGVLEEVELDSIICSAGFAEVQFSSHQPFPPVTAVRVEAIKP
ncbi:MAG: methyltransferase domain-containing protein [SAR324 cluster bacterium]|nr:methyltransferase domain-containing protein [SAR324 cluster bacterium]